MGCGEAIAMSVAAVFSCRCSQAVCMILGGSEPAGR